MSKMFTNAAIAATIATGAALSPNFATAEIAPQQINNFVPSNPTISAESLQAKVDEYEARMNPASAKSPVPVPELKGVSPDAEERFKKAFGSVLANANGPATANASYTPLPFNVSDSKKALELLNKKGGQPVHTVALTGSDGRKYNIVAKGSKYFSTNTMTMDQAFAGQAASDNRSTALVERPAGTTSRYTSNATNVGGGVTKAAPTVGDAPPPTAKASFVLDSKGRPIGMSDGSPLPAGMQR